MKTYKIFIFAALFIGVVSLACNAISFIGNRVEGSGNVITEEREVSDFDRISLTGFGELNIEQGETESLTVRTDENIMPYITTEVRNNTLVIGFTQTFIEGGFNPTNGIRYNLVVKNLSRVDVSGAGSIKSSGLETEKLYIDLSGAGSLDIASLFANELVVRLSGAGSTVISGKVKGQDITLSGAGSYQAPDLESETAIFEMSGIGSATLWATETLDVRISSVGSLFYYGNPRVIQNISGLGKVISLGDK